jgi:hypothetical protein
MIPPTWSYTANHPEHRPPHEGRESQIRFGMLFLSLSGYESYLARWNTSTFPLTNRDDLLLAINIADLKVDHL